MVNKIISALDIGCGKICCMIAQTQEQGELKVLGCGIKKSYGVQRGTISDIASLQQTLQETIATAERMANINIGDKIIVNINGFSPKRGYADKHISLGGRVVKEEDIAALRYEIREKITPPNYSLMHNFELGFYLDERMDLQNPVNMSGNKLGLKSHYVLAKSAETETLHNLMQASRFRTSDIVYTPFASAQSTTLEQERQLGTIVIDMGAETTGICVYHGGSPIFCDCIRFGGHHVTLDIATGLCISVSQAERLKTLQGHLLESSADFGEQLEVRVLSDDGDDGGEKRSIAKSELISIIRARVLEILDMVGKRLYLGSINPDCIQNIVITGGASNLSGMVETVMEKFARPVRLARPGGVFGLAESTTGSEFACIVGMLRYSSLGSLDLSLVGNGVLRGLLRWIMKDPL